VQHTLHAMGRAALLACGEVERVRLTMPNKHCLLVSLTPFGLENANEVFMPTDEPFGVIEATLERA
jgi:urate oxidase